MSEIFDQREAELVARVLEAVEEKPGAAGAGVRERIGVLADMAAAMSRMPVLRDVGSLGRLLDQIVHADRYAGDLGFPARAGFAHAFLVAKIEVLKALRAALPSTRRDLRSALRGEVAQAVFTLLAEELLRSLLYDKEINVDLRSRAARLLVGLWDATALVEIDDLCPSLELLWDARTRANSVFGTLMGTAEYFQLVQVKCPETVLAFFSRNEIPEAESQAFQEFLLGLPWDDVLRLRDKMKREGRNVIDSNYALSNLTLPPSQLQTKGDPEALHASFRRRLYHTELRKSLHQPGPTRTAEAYLLVHLLQQDDQVTIVE